MVVVELISLADNAKVFDLHAEQAYFASDTTTPPSLADLDQLEADMRLWMPDFSLFQGKNVLDLGAGKAPLGTLLARRLAPARVVCLDVGLHRLRAATGWMQLLPVLSLMCGDAFELPFADSSFDCVVANSFLHHLPKVDRAVAEIARVTRSGGYYLGREPNFDNPALRLVVFKLRGTFLHRATCSPNEYPLRAREIIDAFHRAGYRCEIHYFWRRIPRFCHPTLSVAMSVRAQRTLPASPIPAAGAGVP
jgi:SAM-dependent methyltransferase